MLIAAFIWGTTFVAQTTGMETIGPMTFTSLRYLIGAITVLPFALLEIKKNNVFKYLKEDFNLIYMIAGLGILMFGGIALQQISLLYTKVANAAFLTALYVPLVPIILWVIKKNTINFNIWIAICLSVIGSWLLSGGANIQSQIADILVIIGAFFWAGHIILIGKITRVFKAPFQYAFYQSIICFCLAGVPMLLIEKPTFQNITPVLPEIVYAGFFSVGIAYTLQLIAQRNANTIVAAFILSLESIFAAIAGWFLLNQILTFYAILGCGFIFVSVLLADIFPIKMFRKNKIR